MSEHVSKTTHWAAVDAARALVDGLDQIRDLREQERRYEYSIPDGLRRDQARAAEQIRNALAYFAEMGAPPDERSSAGSGHDHMTDAEIQARWRASRDTPGGVTPHD